MEKFLDYLINQLEKVTAWIGVVGFILWILGLHSFLVVLFILLIVLPEAHFRDTFAGWNKKIKEETKK